MAGRSRTSTTPASAAAASAKPVGSTTPSYGSAPAKSGKTVSAAERAKMVRDAAYFIAQRRGFGGGKEAGDWIAAEKQIDELLRKRG